MEEIIGEIIEEVVSGLIGWRKIPKIIRYILLAIVIGFIEFIFINIALTSLTVVGSVIAWIVAVAMLVAGFFIAIFKIHRN